jgi:integrase/recombinase XerD
MKWKAEPITHNGQARIALHFEYSQAANDRVRKLTGVKWSSTLKVWHVPDNDVYRAQFKLPARNITAQHIATEKEDIIRLTETEQQHLLRFENLLRVKKYTENTLRAYRNEFIVFLKVATGRVDIDILTHAQLSAYLLYLIEKREYSESRLNMAVSVLKFYYEKVSHQPRLNFDLPRPRKRHPLPKVIDKQLIVKLLNAPENTKHKTMLMCAYAAGLRVSEVAALKVAHIDSARMTIRIEQGKGKKDRYVMLSQKLLDQLRLYFKEYKPKLYLFEGQYGAAITTRTIQQVFTNAKQKAGLKQDVGIHSLRHSFATHLHESGIDIKYIGDLLGHNSIKTTSIYTHVSKREIGKIRSPLDE